MPVPATADEIAAFKQGASDRYAERKVKRADAQRLFDRHIQRLQAELQPQPVAPPATSNPAR